MQSFLGARHYAWLRNWFLFSPAVLLIYIPFLQSIKMSYVFVFYNSVLLGSFHILLTPLFVNLLDRKPELRPLLWRNAWISIAVLSGGALIYYFSDPLWSILDFRFFSWVVVCSVVFHSLQQQLGILASLRKLQHWQVIKFLFVLIILTVCANSGLNSYEIHARLITHLLFAVALSAVLLVVALAAKDRITLIFLLRLLTWPAGIYFFQLQPLGFAIHGIEYLTYYLYVREGARGRVALTADFWCLATLTVATYLVGSIVLTQHPSSRLAAVLLSFHFGLQFRHYWLDRQLFKLSRPLGREMQNLVRRRAD